MAIPMPVTLRSFAKINLGLRIGPRRADGFHELRTVYQTIGLHDVLRLNVQRGSGIEIRCDDPRVPTDQRNTCYKILELAMAALRAKGRVRSRSRSGLPVQGGLGGASGNAVAALLALEMHVEEATFRAGAAADRGGSRLRRAAVPDWWNHSRGGPRRGGLSAAGFALLPVRDCYTRNRCIDSKGVCGVGFADGDAGKPAELRSAWTDEGVPPCVSHPADAPHIDSAKLTQLTPSDRINTFGREISAWLSSVPAKKTSKERFSGVPAMGRGRAETLLLDLVRTGIENDFEKVVFPQYPALRDVKCALERAGAMYASLSGSGSALYGLFRTKAQAEKAAARLRKQGIPAQATVTLTRPQYWKKVSRFEFLVSNAQAGEKFPLETRNPKLETVLTGPSTNGRSSAFGALCLGSNPSGPASSVRSSTRSDFVAGSEACGQQRSPRLTRNRKPLLGLRESPHGNFSDAGGKKRPAGA